MGLDLWDFNTMNMVKKLYEKIHTLWARITGGFAISRGSGDWKVLENEIIGVRG